MTQDAWKDTVGVALWRYSTIAQEQDQANEKVGIG